MTPIERLEKEITLFNLNFLQANNVGENRVTASIDAAFVADLAALLECVRALYAFVHTQTASEAELHVITAARIEAEEKVGLDG